LPLPRGLVADWAQISQVFNYLVGSLSRIFTTLQEVDDKLILYWFVASFLLNAVLAAQMIYYWQGPQTASHAKKVGEKPGKVAAEPSGATTGTSRSKTSTTRRRA
jgi:mannose-P-dolichol utilization defect 1